MPLVDLWDVKDPGPPKVRKSLRGVGFGASWDELVSAEPKLQAFMDEVVRIEGRNYQTCPVAVWYGWAIGDARKGIKGRMARFIGADSLPFHAAYRALYRALPSCQHCMKDEN